jgi:hypothetical protein
MFFDKIRPLYFFIAFAVGLLLCYVYNPSPEVIVKFPSPYNAGNIVYKDKADSCYKFDASKVSCPVDTNLIKQQPIHEDFSISKEKYGRGNSGHI